MFAIQQKKTASGKALKAKTQAEAEHSEVLES